MVATVPRVRHPAGFRRVPARGVRARQARRPAPSACVASRRTTRRAGGRRRRGVCLAFLRPPLPEQWIVTEAAIKVSQLEKTFAVWRRRGAVRRERTEVTAVAGVSFTVAKGEMIG